MSMHASELAIPGETDIGQFMTPEELKRIEEFTLDVISGYFVVRHQQAAQES